MDTSRSAPVWRSCPSVLLGKELTLVELIIYPWIDTGVIQSFRIRTKTKKKIRVEMTPLITTKPLAHSNSTTTTVRQRNPTLPPNNLKTDCSCPFHRIYVFSDTSMLHKMSTPPSQTTTSVYHQNKASIVFAWGQKNEKGMRESKNWKWCDLQGYSGTVLVKKEKKNSCCDSRITVWWFYLPLLCYNHLYNKSCVFPQKIFTTIWLLVETTDPGQGKFLINDNTN